MSTQAHHWLFPDQEKLRLKVRKQQKALMKKMDKIVPPTTQT